MANIPGSGEAGSGPINFDLIGDLIGDLVADLIFDLMHFFGSAAGIWILSTITPLSLFAVYENERV